MLGNRSNGLSGRISGQHACSAPSHHQAHRRRTRSLVGIDYAVMVIEPLAVSVERSPAPPLWLVEHAIVVLTAESASHGVEIGGEVSTANCGTLVRASSQRHQP